jgi:hypothetical protein
MAIAAGTATDVEDTELRLAAVMQAERADMLAE